MVEVNFVTKKIESSLSYGRFEISPLPHGFGHTLGNSIRRVLLSSIKGSAATYVKINNVRHPFSTIKGVRESVVDIILNIKKLRFTVIGEGPYRVKINTTGKSKIYGKDFKSGDVDIINKDEFIAEITSSSAKLDILIDIEEGVGYSPSEEKERKEVGLIPVDSLFSPITKCNFRVEGARVGRVSKYDKLIIEVWTDSTISPEDALKSTSKLLADFYQYMFSGKDVEKKKTKEDEEMLASKVDEKVYETIIDELDLPTRVINALLRDNIETVGDLIKRGRDSLVDLKGVGKKSIDLIDKELNKLGVEFE